jgi:hypothetical protein
MSAAAVKRCRELYREDKLIPFIGAGLSTRFKLPSWSQLIDLIAEELGWDGDVFKATGVNYLQLAEYYVVEKRTIGPLRSRMDKLFNPPNSDIQQSRAHKALASLKLPIIYTTNYDEIIERAFELNGNSKYHTITNIEDIQDAKADVTQIVKFHGTFADDKGLVLTESSYFDRLDFESALDIKLRGDMLSRALLFIGYSFSDPNIRLILYKLSKLRSQNKSPARFPTAIMTTFGPNSLERTLLSQWEVEVVELDPVNRDESLDEFLESLG